MKIIVVCSLLLIQPLISCSSAVIADTCKEAQLKCLDEGFCIKASNNGSSSGEGSGSYNPASDGISVSGGGTDSASCNFICVPPDIHDKICAFDAKYSYSYSNSNSSDAGIETSNLSKPTNIGTTTTKTDSKPSSPVSEEDAGFQSGGWYQCINNQTDGGSSYKDCNDYCTNQNMNCTPSCFSINNKLVALRYSSDNCIRDIVILNFGFNCNSPIEYNSQYPYAQCCCE